MGKEQLDTGGIRDTCPHCGGLLQVETIVRRGEEDPRERKTVPFAESNHPAIVAERRRQAGNRKT